jgi:hypothetical protein
LAEKHFHAKKKKVEVGPKQVGKMGKGSHEFGMGKERRKWKEEKKRKWFEWEAILEVFLSAFRTWVSGEGNSKQRTNERKKFLFAQKSLHTDFRL